MPKLEKGQTAPLNVTKEAQHRIFCGLGWDPKEGSSITESIGAFVKGKKPYHDLDLTGFMFDMDLEPISNVNAKAEHSQEELGQIYHSGDNVEGVGDGDDEQVSVELKTLNPNIHHIMFQASVKSGHSFGDITSPEIRLVDGYSGHSFLHVNLECKTGRDENTYVFCALHRETNDNWTLRFINEYISPKSRDDWLSKITKFMSAR